MPLNKSSIDVRFGRGLDQKTDKKQVTFDKFLLLENQVFDVGAQLTKRNGFGDLTTLPADTNPVVLSTFLDSLVAVGSKVQAYSRATSSWKQMGTVLPVELDTFSIAKPNESVSQCDSAVSTTSDGGDAGLVCTVFTSTAGYFYQVTDANTGATVVSARAIPSTGTVNGAPKVFALGRYFVIVFSAVASATERLQYFGVSTVDPSVVTSPVDLTTNYSNSATTSWDGVVANNSLFVAWNGADVGGAVRVSYIDSTLAAHTSVAFATQTGTVFGLSADTSGTTPIVYVTYANATPVAKVLAVNQSLATVLAPTIFSSEKIGNLAPLADSGSVSIFYELVDQYSYDATLPNNAVKLITISQAGSVGSPSVLMDGVGLASKAFEISGRKSVLTLYSGLYENGYFLVDSSGIVTLKLANGNAVFAPGTTTGYLAAGLPSVSEVMGTFYLSYLIASEVQPINRSQGKTATGVYLKPGVNVATLTPDVKPMCADIGGSLLIAAGLVSMYDGASVVEHGFNVWPDQVKVSTSGSGGHLSAQQYYYQVTEEWTDAQGMLHRSAPSVPVGQVTTGTTSTNTIHVPTLRLTQKTGVRLCLYRWSAAQPVYYLAATANNDPTVDSVTFTDTLADASILGNAILYTNAGVVENIGAPTSNVMALFRSRVFLLNAEDQNEIWFSKVVAKKTPVEFFDGFAIFCAPTLGAQGSTGPIRALGAMDDKLIIFKKDAPYYETGQGPDATGAFNDYQDPVFIPACVGCDNPQSIVVTERGLIFQSDKGRWLLGRDLRSFYIGAPVEGYNDLRDTSAVSIPGTNQIRISTAGGPILMYDYYYDQWGTFTVEAESSCIVDGVHTTLDQFGRVREERPGTYVDGSSPVLIGFVTGWAALAGIQGLERVYFMQLLGSYLSAFYLKVGFAFNFNPVVVHEVDVIPDTPNADYGGDPTYGAGYVNGGANDGVFKVRVFPEIQKCESFQVTLREIYDPSYGTTAGAGLTLSGMNLTIGVKKGYRTQSSDQSFG